MSSSKLSTWTARTFALTTFASCVLLFNFQNCAPIHEMGSNNMSLASMAAFQWIDANILQPKCVSCHDSISKSGGIDLSSYGAVMASGSVVAGQPQSSTLYMAISQGLMPKDSGHLSSDEIQAVYAWIEAGALNESGMNSAPTVSAGADISANLPALGLQLQGSALDSDGSIQLVRWGQLAGPNAATLSSASSLTPSLSNLTAGTYLFELYVEDNSGANASDTVVVTVGAAPNQSPTVNAGADRTVTLPLSSIQFSAQASDPDGTIAAYQWQLISGPSATLLNASTMTVTVQNLLAGTYQLRVTVTDNSGATASDQVALIVNAAPNQPPTANAGPDKTIQLPTNSVSLSGSGTDADGTIAGYAWLQISGPTTAQLAGATTATLSASQLNAGTYVFELRVTDNQGAVGSDQINVFVNAANNLPPIANAGTDKTITLPTNQVTLTGSASDSDGTIQSYAWSQVSGPSQATIGSPNSSTTNVSQLVAGTYSFQLRATDNLGASGSDTVQVTVNLAPNQPPSANAGSDLNITLPTNSVSLNGSGSDSDGTIAAYSWSQTAGPSTATLSGATTNILNASNLVQGTYTFSLRVTDDRGATATDSANVTVAAAPTVNTATYTWLKNNIFVPTCYSCHSGTKVKGNYNMSTYSGVLTRVVPGSPSQSLLYQEVVNNSMPQNGSPLTLTQKNAIRDWIAAGAQNN